MACDFVGISLYQSAVWNAFFFALFLWANVHAMDGALANVARCAGAKTVLGTVKFDLHAAYALNLHVFLGVDDRDDHPVAQTLAKLGALIEKVEKKERGGGARVPKSADPRAMTAKMAKNAGRTRKCTKSNPRMRNREKAAKQSERGKYVFDGNIDVDKSRSAKY